MLPAYEAMGAAYALTWPGEDLAARFPGAIQAYAGKAMTVWALPAATQYATAPGCVVQSRGRLMVSTNCVAPSRLTRLELFDPGWRAMANGNSTPMNRDSLFQTVAVPAGESTVSFDYVPPGTDTALTCCAAGLGLLLWAMLSRRAHLAPAVVLADEAPISQAPRVAAEESP
jgi:hypothetical protein